MPTATAQQIAVREMTGTAGLLLTWHVVVVKLSRLIQGLRTGTLDTVIPPLYILGQREIAAAYFSR